MRSFIRKLLPLAVAGIISTAHGDVYFSEYVEGSSNNKALEIYNSGDSAINLSTYKIEMYFNGNTTPATTLSLNGNIPAKGTFVIAHSSANSSILSVANQTSAASWYNGDDAIVLKNGTSIVDSIGQVGADPGTEWGTGLASTADNTLRRKGSITMGRTAINSEFNPATEWDGFATDSFDDLGKYQSGGVIPPLSGCGDATILISTIQGNGESSPLVGKKVDVEAIVTASFQGANQLGGFFLQESDDRADGNTATSEGIYVASRQSVKVGDRVHVSGTVAETYKLTQIIPTAISVCASGQTLPAATIVQLPVNSLSELEAVEAMRVSIPQALTVNETYSLGRYGEVLLSNGRLQQPTNIVAPGSAAIALQAQNNLNKLILDDNISSQNPDPVIFPASGLSADNTLRSGDTVANLSGILSYDFSQYRLLPTTTPDFVHTNPRPASPTTTTGTNLKVASFNVLNFFNGNGVGGGFPTARGADTANEFARQKAKIVNALVGLNADVVGLTEIENDGYDTYSAITELTASLNAAMNTNVWSFINPGLSQLGNDQISVGIIYRRDRATALGNAAVLDSSVDPLFIDTKNRPTLAQTFRATDGNGVVTIAINHLKSKGSDCVDLGDPDIGDGQGNCAVTRAQGAQALVRWLGRNPTGIRDKDYLIIGDLNAYTMESPVTSIVNAGYTDLTHKFGGTEAYSYVFDGQAGSLDHGLSSSSLTPQVVNAIDWHINADEPTSLDYNTEFKSTNQVNIFYASNAYRSSDHDPLLISLKLINDLDGDGDVDSDDIKIVTAARNTKPSTFDQRDINGDGVIDTNDARILTLQCTRPGCATK